MGEWKHRLLNVDEEAKTGECSNCGFVKVKKSSDKRRWRCKEALKKWPYNYKYKAPALRKIGPCEICKVEAKLVYDHCHTHGHFRGWLCHHCNVMLGMARDNPTTLFKAIEYLKRTSPQG